MSSIRFSMRMARRSLVTRIDAEICVIFGSANSLYWRNATISRDLVGYLDGAGADAIENGVDGLEPVREEKLGQEARLIDDPGLEGAARVVVQVVDGQLEVDRRRLPADPTADRRHAVLADDADHLPDRSQLERRVERLHRVDDCGRGEWERRHAVRDERVTEPDHAVAVHVRHRAERADRDVSRHEGNAQRTAGRQHRGRGRRCGSGTRIAGDGGRTGERENLERQ
ncbi:MAG: hypothetical protein NTV92_05870 [Candidatus Bipolaricaulota bacterium]|nr:hypothetical protein [Candidatus Bipolaricaulota bacterium]